VRASLFLLVSFAAGLTHAAAEPAWGAGVPSPPARAQENTPQSTDASQAPNRVTIPGPLRSLLRMSGVSLEVSPPEVMPLLAHNVVLQGYQLGRATEFLILLRRYVNQATELSALAGPDGNIHVSGCKDAEPLLQTLGYRRQGECGKSGMALITADPEKAFLTADSGFPLLDLEQALQHDTAFAYNYKGTAVPILFAPQDWTALASQKSQRDVLESLLYEGNVARLYWAMSKIEPDTRLVMKKEIGLARLLPEAAILDLYGSQICVRDGRVAVPGGRNAEKQWQEMVGANPGAPAEFIRGLLAKDHGWLSAYYDAMARASASQQGHFAESGRLKRYYEAFRSPGVNSDSPVRLAYRPAASLLVLVARMDWDEQGQPYVPGNLQTWSELLRPGDAKVARKWNKHSGGAGSADKLAESMFALSRVETDSGPLQAYLCLSDLDQRRGPGRRLGDQTVWLMGKKYADFSGQYLIFLEFPELNDDSIVRFLNTAEALNKISDHTLRGNAMGIFQANVGLWQILARQGQIERAQLNSSWKEMIDPFGGITTSAQLVTAGRSSVERVFRAATGKTGLTQEQIINLVAGTRQTTAEGQQVRGEMANRIRSVMEDQRLVSLDTLFALDDGLRSKGQGAANNKDQLAALAGELREFEMPQPIFTNSERTNWAAGTYDNRHTEIEMKTDLVKVIQSSASPKQVEEARGQLATFLRDSLVGLNYAYYEPPGSQVLHNNPLFVRSHDFSGETVMGVERLWQPSHLFGEGSPAGGGAHLIGSLADLPYVLAEAEQNFIAPDHVQALIWQQFVPGLISNAIVPRWWDVSRNELHAVALYQRAGEELLTAASKDEELRGKVLAVLSDRMFPVAHARLGDALREGNAKEALAATAPADSFYLTAGFQQKYPDQLGKVSEAGLELEALQRQKPDEVNWKKLSRDFGVVHPVFAQTYAREFISVRPFPALGGNYGRLMSECWDSGNLYWARLADEMGYDPVLLNRMVPQLTRRMVERIYASDIDDWPATLRALEETGVEFREGKLSMLEGTAGNRN